MDSMEFNKVFAAALTVGIAFMGATLLADGLVSSPNPAKTAIKIEGVGQPVLAIQAADAPVEPISPLLASASASNGEADTKKLCVACHSFNEGGKSGVGPNLYGVVGLPHGHIESYSYSSAMGKMHANPWTFEELNAWLKKPSSYMPGTKMGFAGLASAKDRADIIAYLDQNSKSPVPLPAAESVTAPKTQGGNPVAGDGAAAAPGSNTAPASTGVTPQASPVGGAPK